MRSLIVLVTAVAVSPFNVSPRFILREGISAVSSNECFASSSHRVNKHRLEMVVEPIIVDATIAVVSAVAGAATQAPRIAELEKQKQALAKELEVARSSLTKSEEELVSKISELEDSIFEMDREFEAQSTRAKKRYDDTLKREIEETANTLKSQFKGQMQRLKEAYESDTNLKLDELQGRLRQNFLQEKLQYISELSGPREQLATIRLEQSNIDDLNQQLEEKLAASKIEIENLQTLAKKRKFWWPFR